MKDIISKITENNESNIIKVELEWHPRYGKKPDQLFSDLIIECVDVVNNNFNFDLQKEDVIECLEKIVKFFKESDKY